MLEIRRKSDEFVELRTLANGAMFVRSMGDDTLWRSGTCVDSSISAVGIQSRPGAFYMVYNVFHLDAPVIPVQSVTGARPLV
jgi:hypothetical protein